MILLKSLYWPSFIAANHEERNVNTNTKTTPPNNVIPNSPPPLNNENASDEIKAAGKIRIFLFCTLKYTVRRISIAEKTPNFARSSINIDWKI